MNFVFPAPDRTTGAVLRETMMFLVVRDYKPLLIMSSLNAPKVEYRQLGKSGLKVSVPILAAMSFGSSEWAEWVLNEEQSIEVIQAAWDLGINTIDTANVYSNGESERLIGKWIEEYKIARERIVIATKCFALVGEKPSLPTHFFPDLVKQRDYVNQSGLSRAAIFNAVHASLARLKVTYIDLLQIHRFDPDTPLEETMKALHDLVESGKVRYIGACSMRAWQLALMNELAERKGWTKFVSMQSEYSLLYREEEREMYAYCKYHGIGVIPWSPLTGGLLARPLHAETTRSRQAKGTQFETKLSAADEQIINRVEEIAKKRELKMAQVATAWVASKIDSPIVGANSAQRLSESITTDIKLSMAEIAYLEEPYAPKPVRAHA
ncbi:Aldo-keto reductase dtxS3 [Hypsizygus marmoreus]|uniref:Aldo-keto reductase dtxS3 n=1 Tax=Hypsizygus marmoreus TaxID=39966 RepID=A0A369J3E4_HYPMA|nr:Aldo-keto reductase dtxS3 [Hypsizygus marmoreus]